MITFIKGKLDYPHLFKPKAVAEATPMRYATTVVFSKDDAETLAAFNKAISGIETDYPLLRDGDVEKPGDELYKNAWFFNAVNKCKPEVFDVTNTLVSSAQITKGQDALVGVSFHLYTYCGIQRITAALHVVRIPKILTLYTYPTFSK